MINNSWPEGRSVLQYRQWQMIGWYDLMIPQRNMQSILCGAAVVHSTSSICLCCVSHTRSATALFDYISAGRSMHCAFYHWRPHLSNDCCIGLEQSAGVGPVVSVVASFPQQTENRTFCPVLRTWLRTSHCIDYYYVTSQFKLIVTCPCSLRT